MQVLESTALLIAGATHVTMQSVPVLLASKPVAQLKSQADPSLFST